MSRMDIMSEPNRRMTKREAEPSFEYNVAAEHPSSQFKYRMEHDMINRMYQNKMDQTMRDQMLRDQEHMDSRIYSSMGQMELSNQRNQVMRSQNQMGTMNVRRMDTSLLNQRDNMMS